MALGLPEICEWAHRPKKSGNHWYRISVCEYWYVGFLFILHEFIFYSFLNNECVAVLEWITEDWVFWRSTEQDLGPKSWTTAVPPSLVMAGALSSDCFFLLDSATWTCLNRNSAECYMTSRADRVEELPPEGWCIWIVMTVKDWIEASLHQLCIPYVYVQRCCLVRKW